MFSGRIAMQDWAEMGKALLQTLLIKISNFVDRSGITDKHMLHISMF